MGLSFRETVFKVAVTDGPYTNSRKYASLATARKKYAEKKIGSRRYVSWPWPVSAVEISEVHTHTYEETDADGTWSVTEVRTRLVDRKTSEG